MFDIKQDEMLSKTHNYRLTRPTGWFDIAVHEIVSSQKAKVDFIAVPQFGVQQADKAFFGVGETIEDALADCLTKIKSADMGTLFPNPEEPLE